MPDHISRIFAERLGLIARRLADVASLEPGNAIEVTLSTASNSNTIAVHGCQPEQLATIARTVDGAEASYDADHILRWVEVEVDGVEVTYYRR